MRGVSTISGQCEPLRVPAQTLDDARAVAGDRYDVEHDRIRTAAVERGQRALGIERVEHVEPTTSKLARRMSRKRRSSSISRIVPALTRASAARR